VIVSGLAVYTVRPLRLRNHRFNEMTFASDCRLTISDVNELK
jgi:hypothetical protein